jgi:taurine dioxygenase
MMGQAAVNTDQDRSGIVIRPVSPVMGAEIVGADLSRLPGPQEFERYRDALHTYKVLAFRDQRISKDDLVAFSQLWGPLGEHIMPGAVRDGRTDINVLSNAGPDGKPNGKHTDVTAKRWHTDRSYMPVPAMASLLYGVEVPPWDGDTLFVNAAMAYDALSDGMKQRIDGLQAVHWVEHSRRTGGVALATDYELKKAPPVKHPLAKVHPATGRKAIYCGCHAWKIDGWSEEDSRPLLDELVAHATQDRFIYRHKWRQCDLVIWDNRCTMHAATDFDTKNHLRVLYRTIVL